MKKASEIKLEELGLRRATINSLEGVAPEEIIWKAYCDDLTSLVGIGEVGAQKIIDALKSAEFLPNESTRSKNIRIFCFKISGMTPAVFLEKFGLEEDFSEERIEHLFSIMETILTPRELSVIKGRYGLIPQGRQTLEECGKAFNISKERVRKTSIKATRKCRNNFGNKIKPWLK